MSTAATTRHLFYGMDLIPPTMPVDQYLGTVFHPDCDFVDGHIEERNVGELQHSRVQKMILRLFEPHEEEWAVEALQECRLQVARTRFRIPDVLVLRRGHSEHRIVVQPPLICIEVISPEDTWKRLFSVLSDYLAMGVSHIWALDPDTRTAYRFDADGLHPVHQPELTAPGTEIRLNVQEIFSLLPKLT